MPKRDRGYKLLFSHAEMVRDLLQGFVCEDWVGQLDFTSLEPFDKSLLSAELAARESDLIWKARFGDNWLYLYLLLEFQTRIERKMASRLMTYVGLFHQGLDRAKVVGPRALYPPVLPIVIYSGARRWRVATDVAELITQVPGLERFMPHFAYLLLDLGALAESAQALDRNLAAALIKLENSQSFDVMMNVAVELAAWLRERGNDALMKSWVTVSKAITGKDWLGELTEEQPMLTKRVKEWERQLRHEGWEEGRQEGEAEGLRRGKAELLARLIERKFGDVDALTQARIETASLQDLSRFADRVLEAATLQDVFLD